MALREVVILQDHLGLYERVRALRDAHPGVIAVTPAHKCAGICLPVEPPLEWMSVGDETLDRKCWLKADAMGLAAAVQHAPDADFYWFIESDVVATQDRWKALFREYANNPTDGLATFVHYRGDDVRMEKYFDLAPVVARRHFMMALYRLSRAAVEASIAEAVALRECFSEIAVPWVLQKHGMKLKRIHGQFNNRTFRTKGSLQRSDPSLLNHPVKTNTYGP